MNVPTHLAQIVEAAVRALGEMQEPHAYIEADGFILFVRLEDGAVRIECARRDSEAGSELCERATMNDREHAKVVPFAAGTADGARLGWEARHATQALGEISPGFDLGRLAEGED